MKIKNTLAKIAAATLAAFIVAPAFGADPTATSSPAGAAPNDADMMKQMMEMSKVGENQKTLAQLTGTWSYTVKFWMAPGAPPSTSKGTSTCKEMMDGRYFVENVTGKMDMPGPDGKARPMTFRGMSVNGYDNAKQKFVSSWIDNMGTGILYSEGTYDPASKTFTYEAEEEMTPGTKTKVRETLKIDDKNHHTTEFFEDHGGQEVKTMEIDSTRAK